MTPESEELLSSMCDGASVDPDRLAAALAEPGSATLLVEFARVRRAVEVDVESPRAEFVADLRRLVTRRPAWWHAGPCAPLAVVAALVLAAVVSGAWLGRCVATPAQPRFVDMAACVDPRGAAFGPGTVTAIDGERVRCVVRGEWVPLPK